MAGNDSQLAKQEFVQALSPNRFAAPRLSVRETATPAELEAYAQSLGVSQVCARILHARGLECAEAAASFLSPTLRDHLPDPATMLNLPEAAALILESVAAGKKITVFHDFDVDGLTAGAQLAEFLRGIDADVRCYVPHRVTEGYGLSKAGIDKMIEAGTQLLITVDCGISDVEEIAYAKQRGLQVVILDHHEPASLPPADVIVDPAQEGCPFQEHRLAAAGVVWMLLIVLRSQLQAAGREPAAIPQPKSFLDLAALGTICDMVPLTGVNRLIAHRGLEAMRKTQRVGLRALMEVSGVFAKPRFNSGHVSFGIGPRINAAGRLDDASHVGELFATKDTKRAKRLAEKIDKLNSQRQGVEAQVKRACLENLRSASDALEQPALAVYGADFHQGVIGIVAQRLVEEYYRPAAVLAPAEARIDGKTVQIAKGSVRSIRGFHVAEVLHAMDGLLISGGGHAAAGGFSVAFERIDEFRQAFIAEARARLEPADLQRELKADILLPLAEVDFVLAEELRRLAPFGVGNSAPVLVSENVLIDAAQPIGDKHLRLRLRDGKVSRQAVAWNFLGHPRARRGEQVTAVYQVDINTYQGVSSVQLNIKALL